MTISMVVYLAATPNLPNDSFASRVGVYGPLSRRDWRAIGAILALMLPVSLFWATYEQQGNTIVLWASENTDRHLFAGLEIPITWFQALNPLMIFTFTPFVVALWRKQGAREPSTVVKLSIGLFLNAASWLIMLAAARVAGGSQASLLWLFAFFATITVGELYLSPTSLSLVTKMAPAPVLSMLMGIWLGTSFFGNLLAGYLGTFWSSMGKGEFFMLMAIISAVAGLSIAIFARRLSSILKD
jgi:POT family proton-dependent oligopeptide transporter